MPERRVAYWRPCAFRWTGYPDPEPVLDSFSAMSKQEGLPMTITRPVYFRFLPCKTS